MLLCRIRIDCDWLVLDDNFRIPAADVRIVAYVQVIHSHRLQLHANRSLYWSPNQEFNLGTLSRRICKWRQKGEGGKFTGATTKVRRVRNPRANQE